MRMSLGGQQAPLTHVEIDTLSWLAPLMAGGLVQEDEAQKRSFFLFFKDVFIYYAYSVVCMNACRSEEGDRSHYRGL